MKSSFQVIGFVRRLLVPTVLVLSLPAASLTHAREYDPYIMYVFPAGAARGTTIETMARGRGLEGASAIRISGEGVTAKVLAVEKPSTKLQQRSANRQDQAENPNVVKISVTVAPDAKLGQRDLRVITPKGATNRFRFFVGQVPEVLEVEPNSLIPEAQVIESLPIVINGQAEQADRDIFRFDAKAGQTLVCEVLGRKVMPYVADGVPGWFQASLTLYDGTGTELAYVDDFRFHPDPVLIYKVPKDGPYMAEIKDVLFRGREDFVYRLSIGVLPYVTHIYPLGASKNSDVRIELHGVNLAAQSVNLKIPADSPPLRQVKSEAAGFSSNELPLAVDDLTESSEAEPNDSVQQANKVEFPTIINGRIQKIGDVDHFAVSVKAKQRLIFEVRARRLESPLDSMVTVLNATGGELRSNDDYTDPAEQIQTHHADSRVDYTFGSDGDYFVRVHDVQSKGGPEYAYRLIVSPLRPDYELRMLPDNPRVARGDSSVITVNAIRRDGFNGQIDLAVANLPKGFVVSSAVIPAGQTQTRFTVTAPADAALGVSLPSVTGSAAIGDRTITREAVSAEPALQAFIYKHEVPAAELVLCATPLMAYTMSCNVPSTQIMEVIQGTDFQVLVKVARQAEAKGAIKITADKPPRGITVKPVSIGADKNEATLTISVTKTAPVNLLQNVILTGSTTIEKMKEKVKEKITVVRTLPAIPIKAVPEPPKEAAKK